MKEGNASRLSEVLQGSLLVDLLDEVMPGLVYVYDLAERRNVYTNRSLAELLGYSRQEVAALGEQLMPTILHPDDFERATAHHAGMPAVKDGQIVEIEYRVKDAAGAWHWLHSWETVLARDAQGAACRTLGIAQDVTRRVQIEEELRESRHQVSESEQRWRSIAENPFDFVIVIDRDYKFVYVNFVAPGQRREDLLGKKTPLDFATGEDHTRMKAAFDYSFREGRPTSYEVYVEPLRKWYHSLVGPIRQGDAVTQLSVMTRDITAEKAAQAQAKQVEQQLRQLELKLAQSAKLEAVGRLAGGIAHDFNNLLTGIGGVVELLAMRLPADDPNFGDVLDLRHAVERGAGLTRQLLAFSRQQPIAPTVLELNELLTDTARLLRRIIGDDIELELAPAAEQLNVRADRTQLEQVMLNLAVNARDAMAGRGRLRLELARAHIGAGARHEYPEARPGDFARLTVSDTGPGMDDATLARIFEPFFTTKAIGAGTGLGLAMVHGIVNKAGGFVQACSVPGQGATFDVWLPLVSERAPAAAVTQRSRPGGGETVLLVEDEELVLRFTSQLLERLGYEVLTAARGDDALELVQAGAEFDLLLTDVLLPGLNGQELFRRITALRGAVPVVFMSGYTGDVLEGKGLAEGSAFLQKPFSHDELSTLVRSTLEAHALGR